jgi:hypothetical protein
MEAPLDAGDDVVPDAQPITASAAKNHRARLSAESGLMWR